MKLQIRSCLYLIALSALIKSIQSTENEKDTNASRQGRVNGRIVKLYSGSRPNPIMCESEGFQADPKDCSIFYRCEKSSRGKYNVFRFQCGPGTVYDPETKVCNHPSNTKRSECNGAIALNNLEMDGNDIGLQELPLPIVTVPPLNIKINASDTTTAATDTGLDKPNSPINSNVWTTTAANQRFSDAFDISGIYSWDKQNRLSTQAPLFSTKIPKLNQNDPCTFDGFVGDSYDCKKFYRCVNNFRGGFTRYEFVCSDATIWDDEKQSCNYVWAVRSKRCSRDATGNNISNDTPGIGKDKTTSNYSDITDQNENMVMEKNPNENRFGEKLNVGYSSSDSTISNRIDQNKHHTTSTYNFVTTPYQGENIITHKNLVPINHTENQNSYFSVATESYDRNPEIIKDFTMSPILPLSTKHTMLSSSTTDTVRILKNICTQSGFIGDPNDCKKFYRCVDNGQGSYTKYDFSCSQGTLWDSEIEACNHAWAVKDCGNTAFSQSSTSENSGLNEIISGDKTDHGNTNDNDVDDGYLNQIEDFTKTTTPKIETTFSLPSTNRDINIIENSCSSSGFFVNSIDCSKFYRCVENGRGSFTRFDYSCGEGTLWDETIEACNHAWAVKSCKSNSDTNVDTVMTTITLVQTTTQENIDNSDYDSMYISQQSTIAPITVTEFSPTTSKQISYSNKSDCDRNGFRGDSTDCKKFYRCVENEHGSYTRYEFSCGDGTVWDPTIEACNYDSEVKDCRSSPSKGESNNVEQIDGIKDIETGYVTPSHQTPDKPIQSTLVYITTSAAPNDMNTCKDVGFMGDPDDCEKFYRCIDNGNGGYNRIEFKCAEGTVWDTSIEACNHRRAVEKCGKGSNNEFSETTTNSVTTGSGTSFVSSKPPVNLDTSTQYTSTDKISEPNDFCVSEGFFGSSSGDCKKFYRCVDNGEGYTKYDFQCGDGTIWDQNIQACNHATNNTTCKNDTANYSNKPQSDNTLSTHAMETTTTTSTTNIHASPYPNDKECTSEGFVSDPSDCKKFFRCVDNGEGGYTKFEFSCGEGTVWIQEIQACDHDTDAISCDTQKITTTKSSAEVDTTMSSENVVTENVVPDASSSTESTVEDSGNKNNNEKCTEEGFYPNKNDCQRFYRCVEDGKGSFTKYEFTCSEGTAWDTLTQSCNYISQVSSCKKNDIPVTELNPDSNNESTSETNQINTSTTLQPTITTTNSFDGATCTSEGFFGDGEDCKMFYRCVSNEDESFTKYVFTCGDGTIWDQDITACNHPEDVSNPSCKLDRTSSTISSTSRTTVASSNTDNASTQPTVSKPSSPASTAIGSATTIKDSNSNSDSMNNNNYTCPKAGFYADLNNCKKFYRCVDWENNGEKFSIYHFECGDGTIWDPALETCNHEDSVYPPRNCNGGDQQNQTNSISPSTTEKSTTILTETQSTGTIPEKESTYSTTPQTSSQSSSTIISTTESKPMTTTNEKSTTQTSTAPSELTTTQTSTMSTNSESTTQQSSTTITPTTNESSTQLSSTINSEVSTTDSSSSQTNTYITEATTSVSTTTNVDETSTTTAQSTSTLELSSTTEVTTSDGVISSQTTESGSTTTDSTTVTNSQDSSTESNTSANKDCPETEEDQYLYVCPTSFKRHPKYCNMFYQCTEDNDNHEVKVAVFNCPNNTIYDETKIQCVEEKQATKKCNGQISQRQRVKRLGTNFNEPVIVSKDSMRCSGAGQFPFEKREQCSPALLKCEYTKSGQLRGFIYKCPEGFVYWTISRRCEAIRKVQDCKLSSYNWNKRYDIPVERQNIGH